MKRGAPELDPELESLFDYRSVARQVPDEVRARVLARGRAFMSGVSERSSRRALRRRRHARC